MKLDDFLPDYQFRERHHILIKAPARRVYEILRTQDWGESRVVRTLLRLRGFRLKQGFSPTMQGGKKLGFLTLADEPERGFIFGLAGRFWNLGELPQMIEPHEFLTFAKPGYAKAAGDFVITPLRGGWLRIGTETRVECLDPVAEARFRVYWLVVRPFSGLIRILILRLLKKKAEAA